MSSVQRVDHLMAQANSLPSTQTTRDFYEQDLPRFKRNASERNITVRRRDGSVCRVDLLKFRITGLSRYNPYLCEGDVVFVPGRKLSDNNIGVLGGVIGPTNVEFAEGDRVTDLVQIGFGLKAGADPSRALLARESPAGGMDTLRVDLRAILDGRASDLPLLPGDRLLIPERPETRAGEFVTVEGAVQRPGRYPITSSRTTLRELLREAGGCTPDANPAGSTLMRVPLDDLLQAQLSARSAGGAVDSGYYAMETALRKQGEMVSVDFRRLILKGDSTADVTLRNRDHLSVPVAQRSVYVFGQVLLPGHVPFVSGEDLAYYIARVNGYTDLARPGDVKVIKAGTRAWLDPPATEIEDGDMIWVPRDNPVTFEQALVPISQVAAIVGVVATLIILAKTL
jgi:protein involved in polysaccharide export with SLBB domain